MITPKQTKQQIEKSVENSKHAVVQCCEFACDWNDAGREAIIERTHEAAEALERARNANARVDFDQHVLHMKEKST